MRIALIILLFITLKTNSQVAPFVSGKSYGIGSVVSYPTPDIMWTAKKATTSKAYPIEGTVWTRFIIPVQPSDVNRKSIDSLYKQIGVLKSTMDSLVVKVNGLIPIKQKDFYIKYSLYGTPLIRLVGDTGVVPALVAGRGITFEPNNNQIIIHRD
jgi:hypothetical protein